MIILPVITQFISFAQFFIVSTVRPFIFSASFSVSTILRIFFAIHDPTTLNRQGYDIGSSYRSVIFHHSEEQKNTSEAIMKELDKGGPWDNPIVTEIKPLDVFYVAEGYHQNYYQNNKFQPYCQGIISPKLAKFRKEYLSDLKSGN